MVTFVRKHFILPAQLAQAFAEHAGPRHQSERVAELIAEWLRREDLLRVLDRFAGTSSLEDHPEWATSEDVAKWVHDLRAGDERDPYLAVE